MQFDFPYLTIPLVSDLKRGINYVIGALSVVPLGKQLGQHRQGVDGVQEEASQESRPPTPYAQEEEQQLDAQPAFRTCLYRACAAPAAYASPVVL